MFGDPRLQMTANVALPLLHSLVLLIVSSPGCLSAIQLPHPGNQANVATGTTNLTITATVTTSPTACSWEGTGLSATEFYSSLFGCVSSSTATHNITCTNSAGVIMTTLTYLTSLTSNSTVSVNCDLAVVTTLSMIVKDCKPNMGSGVIATTNPTSSCGFGCTVQYSCATDHTGNDVNATCQEDATFDNDPVCIQNRSLSPEAIAGIVTGCIIAVAPIIFFLIPICCAEICCCAFTILCLSWGKKKYTAGRS
uniref:VCRL1 variant G n=1 Tax=Ciona intestinalis TaxID=7719 RepID=I3NN95_CIOIN|nr:vCRL1 variant G [Ciona intestinalis]